MGLEKPFRAVTNRESNELVTGVTTNALYSKKVSFTNNGWVFENAIGFYAYYPQLSGFANSGYRLIKEASLESVTVNKFNEGEGTEENPYIIRNHYDMEAVSQMTLAKYRLEGIYFKVAEEITEIDLTLLEDTYIPIGNNNYHFQGFFEGSGVIFKVDFQRNADYQGIFGVVGTSGELRNFGVKGAISGNRFVGGVVGRNYGLIEECYNLAKITALEYAGGIAGYSDGHIYTTYNTGNITATNRYAGGITGGIAKNRELRYAYNTGDIHSGGSGNSWTETGGIAGYSAGKITDVYSAGVISGKNYLGGIIGRLNGVIEIENAYYVRENNLYSTQAGNKATQAIGNGNLAGAKAIYKNQIIGDQMFGVEFDSDVFVLKQSAELVAYYPQLKAFETHHKAVVKEDSNNSVEHPLLYGQGELLDPYMINSSFDLRALGIVIKQGFETTDLYFSVHDQAEIDFELIKYNYFPVGIASNPFKGKFDGNNILMNVEIVSENNYQGIFGCLAEEAFIENVKATGFVVGTDFVGLIVGHNEGQLENIFINEGKVTGEDYIGLFAGYSTNKQKNISAKGMVNGIGYLGGLIGYAENLELTTSYFLGKINASGNYLGGLIGYVENNSTIDYVFSYGAIEAPTSSYVGGLYGLYYGETKNSYATIDITANSDAAGIAGTAY